MSRPGPPAVLLLAFNRPDTTRRVLEAVRAAGVERLYVSLDAPRDGNATDPALCREVLDVVTSEPWATALHLNRRLENRGLRTSVVDGVDWFFEAETEGVVLEDDCMPEASFLEFARVMLERYGSDERIWMVTGSNLLTTWRPRRSDYFFGDPGVWGWATWRRAWQRRDMTMADWADPAARARAKAFLGPVGWRLLAPRYAECFAGLIDSWAYPWSWNRAASGGLGVVPAHNLVTNIGFRADATHTTLERRVASLPTRALAGHRAPKSVRFDHGYQIALAARDDLPTASRSLLRSTVRTVRTVREARLS